MDLVGANYNNFETKGFAKNNKKQSVNFGDNKPTEKTSQSPKLYSKTSKLKIYKLKIYRLINLSIVTKNRKLLKLYYIQL